MCVFLLALIFNEGPGLQSYKLGGPGLSFFVRHVVAHTNDPFKTPIFQEFLSSICSIMLSLDPSINVSFEKCNFIKWLTL